MMYRYFNMNEKLSFVSFIHLHDIKKLLAEFEMKLPNSCKNVWIVNYHNNLMLFDSIL